MMVATSEKTYFKGRKLPRKTRRKGDIVRRKTQKKTQTETT
jgi:hypothetical protein